jgi:hypothetical protein
MRLINRKHKSRHKSKHKRNLSKKQKRSVMSAGAGSFRKRIVKTIKNPFRTIKNAFRTIKNPFGNRVRVEIAPAHRTPDHRTPAYRADLTESDVIANITNPDDRDNECIICFNDMNDATMITRLSCGHKFHTDCIRDWLSFNNTCPVCKRPPLTDIKILQKRSFENYKNRITEVTSRLTLLKNTLEEVNSSQYTIDPEAIKLLIDRIRVYQNMLDSLHFSVRSTTLKTIQYL